MSIYLLLDQYKKKRLPLNQFEDHKFYSKNRFVLSRINAFQYLTNDEPTDYNLFRSNIIIQGYLNKKYIEEEVKNIVTHLGNKKFNVEEFRNIFKQRIVQMPYFTCDGLKIYIPFFSKALNSIYALEPEKLLEYPYNELSSNFAGSIVDPFDTYGYELFDSFFTRLVKISSSSDSCAYFHYDSNTIYFINKQGRLDCKLVLFDKFIKHPNYNHMLERVRKVTNAYFSFDKEAMINALYDNKFISSRFLYIYHKKEF